MPGLQFSTVYQFVLIAICSPSAIRTEPECDGLCREKLWVSGFRTEKSFGYQTKDEELIWT
jgi:hypothetical protein